MRQPFLHVYKVRQAFLHYRDIIGNINNIPKLSRPVYTVVALRYMVWKFLSIRRQCYCWREERNSESNEAEEAIREALCRNGNWTGS